MGDSWAVMAERMRAALEVIGIAAAEMAERMRPLLVAFADPRLRFELWLYEQPRWQRPLMRFAYWIEGKVLR